MTRFSKMLTATTFQFDMKNGVFGHNFGGIRIEDNVLITKKKQQILGIPIPKTIKEVETIRATALTKS